MKTFTIQNELEKTSYSQETLEGRFGILCMELASLARSNINVLHNLLNPEYPGPSLAINNTTFVRQLQKNEQKRHIVQAIERFPSLKNKLCPPGPDYYHWEWPKNSRFKLIQTLSDPEAATDDLVTAILHVSTDRLRSYEPVLLELISHKDVLIRSHAIEVLIGIWGRTDVFDEAYRFVNDANKPFDTRKRVTNGFLLWANNQDNQNSSLREKIIKTIARNAIDEKEKDNKMFFYRNAVCIIMNNRCIFSSNPDTIIESDRNWEAFSVYT